MKRLVTVALAAACAAPANSTPPLQPPVAAPPVVAPPSSVVEDPYLWLEDVMADRALGWARERNATTKAELEATAGFATTRDRIRAILDSKDKIPFVTKLGRYYYNLWTDADHKKGMLRRTTLAEYRKPAPAWEVVLDVDALSAHENVSWVFKDNSCLFPTYDRCLISLSPGGGDSLVVREFDVVKKAFVSDGFTVPEAKSFVSWKDRDTLYVATDFGPGTVTKSGYPRTIREWKRGTKLSEAVQIFEGQDSDVSVNVVRSHDGKVRDLITRRPSFFTSETFLRSGDSLIKIDTPLDARVTTWHDQLLVALRSPWVIGDTTWPKGALLAIGLDDFLTGKRSFTMLFEPAPTRALAGHAGFASAVVVNELDDVKSKLWVWTMVANKWQRTAFDQRPSIGTLSISPVDPYARSDDYWLTTTDFLTPSTLSTGRLTAGAPVQLKQTPAFFDAKGFTVTQHFTSSADGTRIPYFQIAREAIALDGNNPTVLYGYGGFEIAQTPRYSPVSGAVWQERGGVYVVANIRGGGEYGPAWHQAGLRENRQRVYEDFIAVAEHLIARKVTSPGKLGIVGGSNGGLLTGVMLTQRPDLFGAVVSAVPLLDMKRYHKLLAGASWMEEYGDPEQPAQWASIKQYSPYHNVVRGKRYPPVLFTSSTRDDRVHPGHARKMVARMLEQGHHVLYYENIEGGHGGAADNEQAAFMQALQWTFFAKQLGLR